MTRITIRVPTDLGISRGRIVLADMVRELVSDVTQHAERSARLHAPKDTDALTRSITHSLIPTPRGLIGEVSSPLKYAAVMDQGRRPGARMPDTREHTASGRSLRAWAQRHGWTGSIWLLAWTIHKKGIRPRKYFEAGAKDTKRAMPTLIQSAMNRMLTRWRG